MTRASLCFESIQVVRAPGFETGGFAVDDLSPGVNVVHGPNAAGKTTLAESVEVLCWPAVVDARTSVVGHVSLDGDSWRIAVEDGRATYQQNEADANAPSLPAADQRDRYWLSLHDLLQRDTHNESFAEVVERELAGGYDIEAAAEELGYSDAPSRANANVVQHAQGAADAVQEVRTDVAELRQEKNELSRLRRELETARDAADRVGLLEQAIDYANARAALEDARSTLEALPEVLADVDGDEIDRVRELADEIDEWTSTRDAAEETIADARERLEEASLPAEGVPAERLEALNARRDDLEAAEKRRRDLEGALADAEERRASVRQDIPLDVTTEDLASLEPVTWRTVSKFARDAEAYRAKRETRTEVDRLLADADGDGPDRSTLQRASQSLERYLAATADRSTTGDAAVRIAVASALALAGSGVALGALVHPVLYGVLVVAAGILYYGVRARSRTDSGTNAIEAHRESFEETGVEPPASWTRDAVRKRLLELYDAIADRELAAKRAEWRETLAADTTELERAERALAETRADLVDQLGATPDATDVELAVLSKRVLDWQAANDDVDGTRAELETVTDQVEALRDELADALAAFGAGSVRDSSEATEAIRRLERREQNRADAQRALEQAQETLAEADATVEELTAERDALFARANLDPGETTALARLCERVPEYESALEDVTDAEIRATAAREDLENYPGFEPELAERDVGDLQEAKREAEARAEGFENVQSRIADIEAEIRRAKGDDAVETALAERERAFDDLRERLDADYAAMVGDVLVEHVQEATLERSRPAVFDRAREILSTVTYGRYRLDFDETDGSFRAYDETAERGLALDELSSGTRLHVLLAVRIAFVEHHEQGVRAPLLLDETLANTDDRRANAIVDAAIELASRGRQVFYFTAQGDEVAKWRAALAASDVEHAVVDLASVRDLDDAVHVPDLDDVESFTPDPPSATGHDHASYGNALDVPAFDPRRGVGTAHLWYVVDDVDALEGLLSLGIERWGQLENLRTWGTGEHLTEDADALDAATQNAAALEAFVDAWTIGRGDPVDRAVLEASGAVSDTFIEDVAELARSHDGDAGAIVDALRAGDVDRFRSGKIEELGVYFEENGYVEPRDPLDDGQVRARVVQRYVEEGLERETATDRAEALLARLRDS